MATVFTPVHPNGITREGPSRTGDLRNIPSLHNRIWLSRHDAIVFHSLRQRGPLFPSAPRIYIPRSNAYSKISNFF